MRLATDSELSPDVDIVDTIDDDPESVADQANGTPTARSRAPMSALRCATLVGLAIVVALAVLVGCLGFRTYQSHQAQAQRSEFLQVARQGAVNLTTIDWQHADAAMRRILDGATGQFYDDFATRSQPFVDVVKQTKSTTVGTITEVGVESEAAGTAEVLVAVTVKTSNAGAPEQDPRAWRMRISVRQVGDQAKVSNVEFVP